MLGTEYISQYSFFCFFCPFVLIQKDQLSEAISCTPLEMSNMCIKNQDFIKFQCSSTLGFCHATQAVRFQKPEQTISFTTALTSALLEIPHAHKTFLELLLKFYKVIPYTLNILL